MVGRSGKKSIGDVVETFILTIGGKVYTDSNNGYRFSSFFTIKSTSTPLAVLILIEVGVLIGIKP